MRTAAILFFSLSLPGSLLADHLWVPSKGTTHLAASLTAGQWDQFLQRDGSTVPIPGEITQFELSLFGEYSPLKHFSVDILIPIVFSRKNFVYLTTDGSGNIVGIQTGPEDEIRDVGDNNGLGDVVLGAKYIFYHGPVSLGVRPHLKIPGSYQSGTVVNAPGDGQVDLGSSLLLGLSIPRARMYVRSSLSFLYRFQTPSNQLEFMVEPGFYITPQLAIRLMYLHVEQFGGRNIEFFGFPNVYPATEEDADLIGVGLSYKASDLIGFFATYQQTVAGRNTANTKAITFGVDLTF